jgi:hypothetical protein
VTLDGPEDTGRFVLNLVSDFSQSGGRFVPARSEGFRREMGGVVGRILLDSETRRLSGLQASDFDLAGIKVYVAGQGSGTTDAGGRFFIGGMKPGLHEVELDPTGLPIELSPERTRLVAEVAPAAATRVDFPVRLELGIAGRVVDEQGRPVIAAPIVVVTEGGKVIAHGTTDMFGLYRLDSVVPGLYTVQVLRGEQVIGSREVRVTGDYLFNQDLAVPAVPVPGLQADLGRDGG